MALNNYLRAAKSIIIILKKKINILTNPNLSAVPPNPAHPVIVVSYSLVIPVVLVAYFYDRTGMRNFCDTSDQP